MLKGQAQNGCTCYGLPVPEGIRFCKPCHRYWIDTRELTSVSAVIDRIFKKKSWSDAAEKDPVTAFNVLNARERGERIDKYLERFVITGELDIDEDERADVVQRLDMIIPWWNSHMPEDAVITPQKVVYSEEDGVAGTMDFLIDDGEGGGTVMDLKNTYSPEKAWALQVGAYMTYADAGQGSVLHVTKDRIFLIKYDPSACIRIWEQAMDWWKAIQEIEK